MILLRPILLSLLASVSITTHAQFGVLDTSFGADGIALVDVNSVDNSPTALAVQPDGKIVVAGFYSTDFAFAALMRLHSDGTLDSSFGTDGIVASQVAQAYIPNSIALQNDGKIVAAGWTADEEFFTDISLVRYNSNGTTDNSFGANGYLQVPIEDRNAMANKVIVQPDGKILVGGTVFASGGNSAGSCIVRLHSDGSLDNTFGSNGFVFSDFTTTFSSLNTMALQPDGKIIVGGSVGTSMRIWRYTAQGELDTAFGADGFIYAPSSVINSSVVIDLALASDGFIGCGHMFDDQSMNPFLLKYDFNGMPITSFGDNGVVYQNLGPSLLFSRVAVSSDKISVAGFAYNQDIVEPNVNQFHMNGELNTEFGVDGTFRLLELTLASMPADIALQSDGKILITGLALNVAGDVYVCRLTSNSPLSVSAINESDETLVYPQPTSTLLHIRSNPGSEITKVQLLDISGKLVVEHSGASLFVNENNYTFDMTAHSSGVYFLTVQYEEGSSTVKVVKE